MITDAAPGWLFRRLLGLVYLFAFWSLARQVAGLIGHDGILPAADYLNQIREWVAGQEIGIDRFRLFPTLAWISTTDAFLTGLSIAGIVFSLLLIVGVAPLVVLPLLWILYLSLSTVGQDFFTYQWDALLLETGFLAIFVAPAVWLDRLRDAQPLPRLGKWLLLWLLFRLTVGSGAIKLASGDPTWRNLTALTFHYHTQPIPTPVAWYVQQLPVWFHKATTAAVIGIELVAPLLAVGPRRLRIIACWLLVGLQAGIALTGNYAFFNLLSASLCVLLLDDRRFARFFRTPSPAPLPAPPAPPALPAAPSAPAAPALRTSHLRRSLLIAVAILTLPVSLVNFGRSFRVQLPALSFAAPLVELTFPFHSINTYGLFAVMTTTRPEIIVQGSEDGFEWKTYEFRYKAGDMKRRPPWVAPHQPRLDWQMWFAALGSYEGEPWFQRFCLKLLEGSPDVVALLERNPFPDRPPRYVRAELYQYDFGRDGWWTGRRLGSYSPVLSLSNARP